MENAAPSPPKVLWSSRRKLLYVLVLLAGCVVAFLFWDTLFMPADLRRMQGAWKVAKIMSADANEMNFGKGYAVTFVGRQVAILHNDDRWPIEIRGGKFFLYDVSDDEERKILGFRVSVPIWLRRANRVVSGTYEFADQQLIFWIKDAKNLIENTEELRADQQMRVYLERR